MSSSDWCPLLATATLVSLPRSRVHTSVILPRYSAGVDKR